LLSVSGDVSTLSAAAVSQTQLAHLINWSLFNLSQYLLLIGSNFCSTVTCCSFKSLIALFYTHHVVFEINFTLQSYPNQSFLIHFFIQLPAHHFQSNHIASTTPSSFHSNLQTYLARNPSNHRLLVDCVQTVLRAVFGFSIPSAFFLAVLLVISLFGSLQ